MNKYIKNRIDLINLAKQEQCEAGDLDEKYSGALWDWAGEIAGLDIDETEAEELQGGKYSVWINDYEYLGQAHIKNLDLIDAKNLANKFIADGFDDIEIEKEGE